MGDRYEPQPQRNRDRDQDRDPSGPYSRTAPRSEPRSQVRLKVPESVLDDDGSDARDDSDRHSHLKSRHMRDENGASDRPALRRRKSVDLERKTSRQNEEFRRRRNELEAQEAGAMRQSDDFPVGYGRRGGMRDDGGRYDEKGKSRDRRDDGNRDEMGRGDRDRHDDGGRRGDRDRRDNGDRRGDPDRRDDGGRRGDRHRRDDEPRKVDRDGRDDEGRRGDRDRRDDSTRKDDRDRRDYAVSSDQGGRRHHGDRKYHEHRREEGWRRGDEVRGDDDGRGEDRPRRGDDSRRGDESHRGKDSRRGGETRDGDDRESESRRHRKRDGPDGPDPISDAVSYGSDPVSRDDDDRRRQHMPLSGGVLDLDQLLEKPPGGNRGGGRPEREAREKDSRAISPSAYDQKRSNRRPRDLEDRSRNEKPGYYNSERFDGRDAGDQGGGYGYAKDRPPRPADWDDRRDRERR